jgi:anti-anti-sigma regulatory factor
MDRIDLSGVVEPSDSFTLHRRLEAITSTLRPSVTIDLSSVEELHPSIVSVLIRHRRQARRQGGDVTLIRPRHAAACRTLDHVGLVGAR